MRTAALLLLFGGGLPQPALAFNEIWHLESEVAEILRKKSTGEDHRVTDKQIHYTIQFEPDEKFAFILPAEFVGRGASGVFEKGSTRYWYREQEGEPWVYFWIPNRILEYREAFLAAERYFAGVAKKAGIPLRFWKLDEPIEIVIGASQPGSAADTTFWRHRIVMQPTSGLDPGGTAVHEYFHLVQKAVWYNGDEKDYWQRYSRGSRNPFRLYLNEMTAEWATDEPIPIRKVGSYAAENRDSKNDYLMDRGDRFLFQNQDPFFETDEYDSNLFIKYFAEQVAGKKDESAAAQVMKLTARMFEMGGVNQNTFFKAVSEMAPPGDFGARSWQLRWGKFFRAFSASNVVQSANSLEDANAPLGYRDDAFTNLTEGFLNKFDDTRLAESSRHSDRVYAEPATDPTEQRNRLETLLGEDELVEAMANRLHRVNLRPSRSDAPPRPVYFFARGVTGTDLFLLSQKYPWGESLMVRDKARFRWFSEFTFSDQLGVPEPRSFYEVKDYDALTDSHDLWVGLVNTGVDLQSKVVAWAYQASPRIIPRGYRPFDGGTETVQLDGGSAYNRHSPREGFYNGDTFELEIKTTGALHRKDADLNDLKPADVAAKLEVLDEQDQEVLLDASQGERVKIRCARTPSQYSHYYVYRFSGKIAEDNSTTGKCRFRIKITSPLNLGGDDEQIDESYEFELRARHPHLQRFRVLQASGGTPETIYDSDERNRKVHAPEGGAYAFEVEATFSQPMVQGSVTITAGGLAPFESYRVGRIRCRDDDKICKGKVKIPSGDVPAGGMLLRFAVAGDSEQGDWDAIQGKLDADPLEAGAQPDTRHFIVLGVREFYQLSQSSHAYEESRGAGMQKRGDLGPIDFEMRLMPRGQDHAGRNSVYVDSFESLVGSRSRMLENVKKTIVRFKQEYEEAAKNPKKRSKEAIRDLKRKIKGLKMSAAGGGPPLPPGQAEAIRQHQKEMLARMQRQLEVLEDKDKADLGKELAEYKRRILERQRKRVAFLEQRYLPLVEAAHRVMNGYKEFAYKEELSGAIPLSFGGLRVEWHTAGGPHAEGYSNYQARNENIGFKQGRLEARGWSVNSLDEIERAGGEPTDSPRKNTIWFPKLKVWDFWPSDLEKVQVLLDLMGNYPDYITGQPETEPGVERTGEAYGAMGQTELQVGFIADDTDRLMIELCKRMWQFFPKEQWPAPDMDLDNRIKDLDAARRIWNKLPVVSGNRLIQLQNIHGTYAFEGLPVEVEGYEYALSHIGDHEGRWFPSGFLGAHAPEMVDRPGFHETKTEVYYEKGHTVRRDVRFQPKFFVWFGITAPPDLIRSVPVPFQETFDILYVNDKRADQRWSVIDSSSPQAVDPERGNSTTTLIQTDAEVVHGTLRVQRQVKRDVYSRVLASFRWDSRYRLEHIGQVPKPDPGEPLPEWTEPGEEPRLKPEPEPESEPEPEPGEPRESLARSYDPRTGFTTESRRNPDGSVTITRTDRDGTVLSRRTRQPRGQQLPSASATDPGSGITTTAERTANGSTRITRTDREGNVLSQKVVKR